MAALTITKQSKVIFALSILVLIYWSVAQLINIYRFAVVGAIYEILWLPMLAMLFLLPAISIFFLFREKFSFRSLYLYSVLLIALTAVLFLVRG